MKKIVLVSVLLSAGAFAATDCSVEAAKEALKRSAERVTEVDTSLTVKSAPEVNNGTKVGFAGSPNDKLDISMYKVAVEAKSPSATVGFEYAVSVAHGITGCYVYDKTIVMK
ncbi:hypothetical protein K2X33_13880 [bacterium]|nr:hypothetical protein [bacterium]